MNNNKGYSLTELLLAIFVLSIVMLGIAGILRSTSQFYRNGTQEVRVQEEAQLAVNLIEEMLVDAKGFTTQDGHTGWNPTAERLQFKDESGQNINITLVENADPTKPGKLVMGYNDSEGHYVTEDLADYVTAFNVEGIDTDPSHANADNKMVVSVSMNNNGYEYTASKEVYMRNLLENPSVSINTVPSGGGGGGSAWDHEVELNRFDPYNLTTWYNIDSTKPITAIGNYATYFTSSVSDGALFVAINESYNNRFSQSSDDNSGIQCTDLSGNTVKIRFYFVPVSVELSSAGDVYVHRSTDISAINGQGYETYVVCKGININKALGAGAGVKVKLTLSCGSESQSKEYTLSNVSSVNLGQDQYNITGSRICMGVSADPQASGIIIGDTNGEDIQTSSAIYTSGGNLKAEFTISPAAVGSNYTKTLNYKYKFAGNVL